MSTVRLVKHHIILLATLFLTACASPGGNNSALLSLGDMELPGQGAGTKITVETDTSTK